jgi:hypothetical protein
MENMAELSEQELGWEEVQNDNLIDAGCAPNCRPECAPGCRPDCGPHNRPVIS